MLNKILKGNKGITLIALVVTIIVLLILAGISINALAGRNGLLNRAVESKEKTGIAQTEESIKIAIMDAATEGLGTLTEENLEKALNKAGISSDKINGDETQGWKVEINESEYQIATNGTMKRALSTIENSTVPYYPEDTFTYKEGELSLEIGNKNELQRMYKQCYIWSTMGSSVKVYRD